MNLGIFGVLGEQGTAYLPWFIAVLVLVGVKAFSDRNFGIIGVVMILGWGWARLIDFDPALGGGALGTYIVHNYPEDAIVPMIASGMGLGDALLAAALYVWAWKPLTCRLMFLLYMAMIACYIPAAAGVITGGQALEYVFWIGLAKLVVIALGASGGGSLVYRSGRRLPRLAGLYPRFDALVQAIYSATNLGRYHGGHQAP